MFVLVAHQCRGPDWFGHVRKKELDTNRLAQQESRGDDDAQSAFPAPGGASANFVGHAGAQHREAQGHHKLIARNSALDGTRTRWREGGACVHRAASARKECGIPWLETEVVHEMTPRF